MSEVVRNTVVNKESAVLMIDEGKSDGAMNVTFSVPNLEDNENNTEENIDDEESTVNPSKKIVGDNAECKAVVTTPRSEIGSESSGEDHRQNVNMNKLHEGRPTNSSTIPILSPKKACNVCGTPTKSSKNPRKRHRKSRSVSRYIYQIPTFHVLNPLFQSTSFTNFTCKRLVI